MCSSNLSSNLQVDCNVFQKILHFREDCGIFCDGEREQQRRLNKHNGLVGFIGPNGLTGLIGLIALIIGLIGLVGLNDCIGHI
jgi:hypothetical protein